MRLSILILLSLLAGGCALSPQQVNLNPEITPAKEAPYLRGSVAVTVFDGRNNKVLGSRGGAYANSSKLTLANDFNESISREAERVLQSFGLEIDNQNPLLTFNIFLEELNYRVPDGSYVTQVDLDAGLRVEIIKGNRTYRGQYQAQSQHRVVSAPDEEKNEMLINEVVNSALSRMLSDRSLLDFLSTP
ncbi:YajG family lipoprotein [Aestuariirhabdus sp. Z084]|uniref:YajG family lipoprotein n=1 Tax=Aestuariirhabdus haliotis TaxID=2918751 RepID=UPI00201B4541|nr:YajG family lipoprotein [Aestuariirhabdus haliotis]MCL6415201.1 YajG family lipoprotein [Aestuariirhabdus haliotis]MCL6420076.1 YajG family lipoprotein [Aestuariirhabdus haliotis]